MGLGRQLLALAAGAAAACGDNHETTTSSGTRLRLQWLAYADGTRQPLGGELWDDGREESCLPQRWSDGNTYCTPNERAGLFPYYLDAGCTQLEYLAQAPDVPRYVGRIDEEDETMSLLAHPESITLASYWSLVDGLCLGPYDVIDRTAYRAGAEVSRSDLVRLRASETTGKGRVAVRATTSDDGLYLPSDFVDRRLHAPCTLDASTASAAMCLPRMIGRVAFREADCTGATLVADQDRTDLPRSIVDVTSCELHVYAVGAETTVAPVFERQDEACAAAQDVGTRWFELVEHPPAVLPRLREAVTGRRLERFLVDVDGVQVVDSQLFDTAIGEECVRATTPLDPDAYYCVPRNVAVIVDGFLDAACTIPFEVGLVHVASRASCAGPRVPRYGREFTGATLVRYLGARRTEPVYFRVDGVCQPDTSPHYDFYELGAAIPDAQWARATIVRD